MAGLGNKRVSTLAWRLLLRDWRSGELSVLSIALVIAVTSLTAVAFLTDRVGHAVELRAAESLAADLRLGSSQPLPASYLEQAKAAGLKTAAVTSMPSVVFAGDTSTLSAVRAVTAGYPLRGRLKTSANLLGEAFETDAIPAPGEAWATTRLLARLGADAGDVIKVGTASLKVSKVLDFRPDQGWQFVDLAPTLLINMDDLDATGLVQPGSRVSYRMLFAGSRTDIDAFKPELETILAPGERLSDIQDTNPQIRSAMERSGRFLNLASLVSVLLAAVAVAMSARRYAIRHRDRIALLKCLGSQQGFILRLNLLQLFMLTVIGAIVGIVLGYLSQEVLAWITRDLIAQQLPPPGMAPVLLGLVTALFILCGFALPDLVQMGRTPVLRVLRNDVSPPPVRYGISYLAGVVAVLALLEWMVRDIGLVLGIAAGAAGTFVVLGLAGWLLVRMTGRFRGVAGVAWRYGLANLSRRGRESVFQVVAFGLGLMVLLLLTLVRNDLMDNWRESLPVDAPNQFLINIQPHEVPLMQQFLEQREMQVPRFVPMVRARMTAINGEDVNQITFEDPQGERWAKRESNLSFATAMQADNRLTEGEWWPPDTPNHEVSVEVDFGSELGVKLGDEISFDIAGEPVSATVTSFRTVEWDSFRPNFFMVFSPSTLKGFPASYISALYARPDDDHNLLEMMREFPSVTVIDLDATLQQVRDVMDKASMAVQAVFLFTLFAGLAVLWAAVQSSLDERSFESAILRALGASRKRVLTGVVVEFIAIGLLAGVLAATGASLAAWYLAINIYDLAYHFSPALWLTGPVLGMVFVGISGLIATWKVVTHSPLSVLRAI
ncbi:MAG: FtsX-like permease family protein [Xanthomonadales bacterium]|nr:FtsX-like permease family protein [Xanthomonadales bacterium]